MKKARELVVGDTFALNVSGVVVATSRTADGKQILLSVRLDNQGRRGKGGAVLEFTHAVEFVCRPGRPFQVYHRHDGDELDETTTAAMPNQIRWHLN